MASRTISIAEQEAAFMPIITDELPILYEDDEEGDLGESNPHTNSDHIVHICLKAHLADEPQYQVYSNLNLYYPAPRRFRRKKPYVSPDVMIVAPYRPLKEDIKSYTIGTDGPVPVLTVEILSERSAQQSDLDKKVILYAKLGVAEYILVDVTGKYLPQRLLLKRLQPDRTWKDERDSDGGVTSRLGFRLLIDADGKLRVLDAATGEPYVRPDEAAEQIRELREAKQLADDRVHSLEAELERLRQKLQKKNNP